jgi:CPA2 family monovalent cation:H+ antiporter-2
MPPLFLRDLLIAYGLGLVTVLVLHRARVPALAGFLVAGALMGPHGFGLVSDVDSVHALADVGAVILLFTVGLEMSPTRFLRSGAALLVAGVLQTGLATAGAALPARLFDAGWGRALVVGLVVSASSTTLVLKSLGERGEIDAPHGRVATGILLFQDLCVVPILLLLPVLGGGAGGASSALEGLGRAGFVIVATFLLARLLVPRVLHAVVATRSREVFALTVIFLCLGTAFLARAVGVPLALGAFLGGLVVSESPYAHQALGDLQPIRDGLSGLFFIGIGMLLDGPFAAARAPVLAAVVVAIVVLKVVTTGAAVLLAGHGVRVAALVALALAQVGEFSFVVVREATGIGVLDGEWGQMLLAAAVLTMLATPFVHWASAPLADALDRAVGRRRGRRATAEEPSVSGHVVIVGYGLCGRNVALALRANGIPFSVLEMNPATVQGERTAGTPIHYGDAGHPAVLEGAGVAGARVLVVAVSDAAATRRIVAAAKRLRPDLHVVVRTRYVREDGALRALGADEVVPEELETSVEVSSRVLRRYGLPRDAIERCALAMRSSGYEPVRSSRPAEGLRAALADALLHVELEMHAVGPGAPVDGKTIGEMSLRKRYGVTIVGVRRGDEVIGEPDAGTSLSAGDVVVVLGRPERLAVAADLFRPPQGPAPDGEAS